MPRILLAGLLVASWQVFGSASAGSESRPEPMSVPIADSPSTPEVDMVMSPFFVFREHGSRVWLERIRITLAGPEDIKIRRELDLPRLRSAVYEALQAEVEHRDLEDRLRSEVSRMLGPEAGRRVSLSRCYLLVP
jgi:hypothetical protein